MNMPGFIAEASCCGARSEYVRGALHRIDQRIYPAQYLDPNDPNCFTDCFQNCSDLCVGMREPERIACVTKCQQHNAQCRILCRPGRDRGTGGSTSSSGSTPSLPCGPGFTLTVCPTAGSSCCPTSFPNCRSIPFLGDRCVFW
jgi:hypothetical protein